MNDIQIHAFGLHAAVNGLSLSRRAALSHALREAVREGRRDRRPRDRWNRAVSEGRNGFTTAV